MKTEPLKVNLVLEPSNHKATSVTKKGNRTLLTNEPSNHLSVSTSKHPGYIIASQPLASAQQDLNNLYYTRPRPRMEEEKTLPPHQSPRKFNYFN